MIRALFLVVVAYSIPVQAHESRPEGSVVCADFLALTPLQMAQRAAQTKLAHIDFAQDGISAQERSYYQPIVDAAHAALEKHHPLYSDPAKLKTLDIPRHMTILRAIAAFDSQKAKLSLYRIKRAIEGRHSLQEYTNCR
ncbi:MAG: hypothetical protein KF799_01055 [Bdellovibrionales bacterium]|nr:hypothetical protein [Bdellovibrionales bacterium]